MASPVEKIIKDLVNKADINLKLTMMAFKGFTAIWKNENMNVALEDVLLASRILLKEICLLKQHQF